MTPLERARPWIIAAIGDDRPLLTFESVSEDILSGKSRLWYGPNSALVTGIVEAPSGERIIDAYLAGGDMKEIIEGAQHIEAWAREAGFTQSIVSGRPGWGRALTGYAHFQTQYRKVF